MKTYYNQTDLAKAIGVSPQVIHNWVMRDNGRLPKPEAQTPKGTPLWSEEQIQELKKDPTRK